MSILDDLYYGNIIPCDSAELLSSEAYNKALTDMVECKSDLEEMLDDFCVLLKELEWWQSNDTSEERYGKAVHEFKQNWLEKSNRACYPVRMTSPGPFPRCGSAYFDPTRRLLFTAYMTEELAKNLGFKWWKE